MANRALTLIFATLRFPPDVVWGFFDEEVEGLGSEDDGTVKGRHELTKKSTILEEGPKNLSPVLFKDSARGVHFPSQMMNLRPPGLLLLTTVERELTLQAIPMQDPVYSESDGL